MTTAREPHSRRAMQRDKSPAATQFHTKSWSGRFVCPECSRAIRVNFNYLGRRAPVCYGTKTALEGETPLERIRRQHTDD